MQMLTFPSPNQYQPQPAQYQHQPAQYQPQSQLTQYQLQPVRPSISAPPASLPPPAFCQGQRQAPLPAHASANPFINRMCTFVPGSGVFVCMRCREEGHTTCDCTNYTLSREEQAALRIIIFSEHNTSPRPSPIATAIGNLFA